MQGQSLNKELRRYFQYSPHVPKASAFVQQRSKILDGTFEFLFKEFNQCFPSSHRFRGYDILATDGSDFDIPFDPDTFEYNVVLPNQISPLDENYFEIAQNRIEEAMSDKEREKI